MFLVAVALPVLATVFSAWQVNANEDCLWYVDKNGTWHNGFDCPLITFCCGNCHRRYCCLDGIKMITEREQKRCMLFQFRCGQDLDVSHPLLLLQGGIGGGPTTIAGIASSILLFVAIIATMVCCFMCSCCYLYQRRMRGGTSYEGNSGKCVSAGHGADSWAAFHMTLLPHARLPQQIPMASYPMDPMFDAYGKPIGHPDYQHPGYPMAPQFGPGVPHQYPMMPQGPYHAYPHPHHTPHRSTLVTDGTRDHWGRGEERERERERKYEEEETVCEEE
ncbi:hypothetical protein JZ751_017430 [Albula glossodonta]|uniref:Shisa N-terminal domain-containing protein n=1 Tax=Albula glossodonta TaxID=121402 RepID=A0A8T2PJV6_9TELE|nr:hypothetical protein JZ751_017430 [Albula glossodonta]